MGQLIGLASRGITLLILKDYPKSHHKNKIARIDRRYSWPIMYSKCLKSIHKTHNIV